MHYTQKMDRIATSAFPARLFGLVAVAVLGFMARGADAAWVVDPSAQIDTRYNDNARLSSEDEESGVVSTASVQARVRRVTEISELSALGGVALTQYSGIESFEDEDSRESMFLLLRGGRQMQRGNLGFDASYRRQDLLRNLAIIDAAGGTGSGLTDGGPPEPGLDDDLITDGNVDQGAFKKLVQRNDFRASPSLSFQVTPVTSIRVGYTYSDISFGDTEDVGDLQESNTYTAQLAAQRTFSTRDMGWIQVEQSRFEPDQSLEADTWNVTVGWSRTLSERTRLSVSTGGRRTENDIDDETGFLFNGRVDRRTNRGNIYALLERTLLPSSFGEVVETDRINVGANAGISERLSWAFNLNAFRTDSSLSTAGRNNQDYLQASPQLRWAATEEWSVGLNYSYTWVDRETDPDSAAGSTIGLSLAYAPRRRL